MIIACHVHDHRMSCLIKGNGVGVNLASTETNDIK